MKVLSKKNLTRLFALNSAVLVSAIITGCGGGSGYGGNNSNSDASYPTYDATGVAQDTAIGTVFTGGNGKTLYTFESDEAGTSNCEAACADVWPPFYAPDSAEKSGDFTIIVRGDGRKQWAFKDYPLYFYNQDEAAGDVRGENIDQLWFVARPDPWQEVNVDDETDGIIFAGSNSVLDVTEGGALSAERRDREGYSLYTFAEDDDNPNVSECNNMCANTWPPLYADKGARSSGEFSVISRDDGSKQWAFKSYPIYFYKEDKSPGETKGHAINRAGDFWYVARPDPIKVVDTNISTVLAGKGLLIDVDDIGSQSETKKDRDGFSLYTFDSDVIDSGSSSCNGSPCAVTWPPLYADEGAKPFGPLTIITRDDESKQWAYNGLPLYFYKSDLEPGDTNGDNLFGAENLWFVARQAPVQRSLDTSVGNVMVARGNIADVDDNGAKAESITDRTGYSLYTFDEDVRDSGISVCNGGCAVTWPPLYAEATDNAQGDFNIISRDDGTLQWAFKGLPLYFFVRDKEPGDFNGVYPGWQAVPF